MSSNVVEFFDEHEGGFDGVARQVSPYAVSKVHDYVWAWLEDQYPEFQYADEHEQARVFSEVVSRISWEG